jgi:CheY-like chemotaxis protein
MAYLLVVDDDIDGRDALCRFLTKAGHEVDCVGDGREALGHIIAHTPDLIIMDLMMPVMDGPSLLEILRSYLRLQALPVIVMTALAEGPMVERARHMKVNAMLVKGKATLEEILQAVTQELHRLPK